MHRHLTSRGHPYAEADEPSRTEQFLSDPSHDYKTLKYGDVMEGIIMHLDRDELLVDIGSKAEGIVPAKEYSSLSAEEKDRLGVGDNILVFVVQPENAEGHPVVSIDRARQEKSWRKLQEIHEANEVIEAEVTNYNKGGLLVNLDGVRGFVPASQVSEIRGGDESSKQADMARLIGTSLPLKVIEINRHRNRLILSERQAIQERRDVMKEKLIEELKEGEVRKGRVSSICDFGAFVDIDGMEGLVHLSELSWSRVRHPSELLKIGEEVDVYVLGINAQEKKIALSIKRTQAEPWSRVAASYEVGKLVRGVVTQLANFGAFARIEDGIEGLIHVSELADERIQHPKQVVSEGQELLLRIIRIDPQRRRMGLSLRRALDTQDDELLTVFGEGILEERDALATKIKDALEAGQFAEREPDDADGDMSAMAMAFALAGAALDEGAVEHRPFRSGVQDDRTVEKDLPIKKSELTPTVINARDYRNASKAAFYLAKNSGSRPFVFIDLDDFRHSSIRGVGSSNSVDLVLQWRVEVVDYFNKLAEHQGSPQKRESKFGHPRSWHHKSTTHSPIEFAVAVESASLPLQEQHRLIDAGVLYLEKEPSRDPDGSQAMSELIQYIGELRRRDLLAKSSVHH